MSSQANQNFIRILISIFMVQSAYGSPRRTVTDKDVRLDAERKCHDIDLPYYKVASKHYCCGCQAGQYVGAECKDNDKYSTICKNCPYNDTVQTYTSAANTQRLCNISKSPAQIACVNFMYTHYMKGNHAKPARCVCDSGTYAVDPEKHGCQKYTPCKPMYYVTKMGTSKTPYECSRCPAGTCTYKHSFEEKCVPCKAANLPNPTDGEDIQTPTTSTEPTAESLSSQTNWSLIIGCCVFSFIVGVILATLYHKFCNKGKRTNSSSSRLPETNTLLPSGTAEDADRSNSHMDDDLTNSHISSGFGTSIDDSSFATNSQGPSTQQQQQPEVVIDLPDQASAQSGSVHSEVILHMENETSIQSNTQEEVVQSATYVEGPQSVDLKADPYDPEDTPLKGCTRTVAPEEYKKKYLVKRFVVYYEPSVTANCLFEAVAKGKDCNLSDHDVPAQGITMREGTVQYIEQHKEQFRSSILSLPSKIEEYLTRLRNPEQPCNEFAVVLRAIALKEKVNIALVPVNGTRKTFCGSSNQDTIYIGLVEENYYLLLRDSCENRDGDINASSNRFPESESRVEMQDQSVAYHSVATDGQRSRSPPTEVPPAVQDGSHERACSIPNYIRPPERLRVKSDWDLLCDDSKKKMKNHFSKHPEWDLSDILDDVDLAKAMLRESPELLPGVIPVVDKLCSTVKAFVRLPKLVVKPENIIDDAKMAHGNDAVELRHYIIQQVIAERGRSLTVRLLLKISSSSRNGLVLRRHFNDCLITFLDKKCSESSNSGPSNVVNV